MIFKVIDNDKIIEYSSFKNNLNLKFTNCNKDIIEKTKTLINNIKLHFESTEENEEENIYKINFFINSNVNLDFIFMKLLRKVFKVI